MSDRTRSFGVCQLERGRRLLLALSLATFSSCQPPPPSAAPPQEKAQSAAPASATLEPGFQWIALTDCERHPDDGAEWSEPAEHLLISTGKPKGYLCTTKEYGNFTLKYDYRFPTPPSDPMKAPLANTGVLLFVQPPHAVWPKSLEVQGKWSEMGDIRPNGGAEAVEVKEVEGARDAQRHAVGEWNSIAVTAQDGALSVELNGKPLLTSAAGELKAGLITFQAEGHAVEYRNVQIRVDP
jgi:hypothetical protein